jgi:hypothetical protein
LRRDALGSLLEQKLKELTCQEDDELTTGAPAKRSTAMILQELISALTGEQHFSDDGNMFNKEIAFKVIFFFCMLPSFLTLISVVQLVSPFPSHSFLF